MCSIGGGLKVSNNFKNDVVNILLLNSIKSTLSEKIDNIIARHANRPLHAVGLTSTCNWYPTDMLIIHKTCNFLSTEEKDFDDKYSINYVK